MAIFIQFLPYLIQLGQSVPRILDYVHKMKANYEARGEWTAEADQLFTEELERWTPEI